MQFRSNTKMADVIHCNYMLLPILNRFNIQLGFGDKTVSEICKEREINTDFFLVIVNSFHDHDYFPQGKLLEFPLSLIIDYIQKSHSYYLEVKVPQVEALITELCHKAAPSQKKQLTLVERFFSEYKSELTEHIMDEENEVYPNVISLDEAYTAGKIKEEHLGLIHDHPIDAFAKKHNNVEEKLYDLKNIIIKYLSPAIDHTISDTLLTELFRLERDLNDHARIENKVMIPKVRMIEQEILRRHG